VDPRQWPDDCMAQVEFVLGYGEAQKEIQKIASIGAALAQDPALAQWFTPKQHHYLATKALEASGRKDVNQILAPLSQPTQPPPNRQLEAEVAMKQADAAAKNAQAQTSVQAQQIASQDAQNKHAQEMAKLEIEKQKLQLELMKIQILHNKVVQADAHHAGQQDIAQAKLAHEVTVDAAEIALQYDALEQQKLTASAQPKG